MRQSGMEKRSFGRQKSGRFQEQKPTILKGNSDLEKRNFLMAKFVAFVTIVEPQFHSFNAAYKGASKSGIFGAPKVGSRRRNASGMRAVRGAVRKFQRMASPVGESTGDTKGGCVWQCKSGNDFRVTGRPQILSWLWQVYSFFSCLIMSFWTLLSRQMIKESPHLKGARKDAFLESRKVRFSLGERCQLFER